MRKVMIVFGTRPEAIKMAPVYRKLNESSEIKAILCVTAQHREMLDQVISIFDLRVDIDLDIMKKGQDLFDVTSLVLVKLRDVLLEERPDLVLVHGDTTTSFATSLACFYSGIKVGHVEAGLRTFNLRAPFPEEFNRKTTGLISDYHFTPTSRSKQNLIFEGKTDESIVITGNTVIDALHYMIEKIETNELVLAKTINRLSEILDFDWMKACFILITGHRRENFGQGFVSICEAIKDLAIQHKCIHFVYPVHLNPNVQTPVKSLLSGFDNIHLIEPLEYEYFVYLLKYAYLILTDSGGIQEEAPSLGKPVLLMRDETERPEAVEAGTVKMVGASKKNIVTNVTHLLKDHDAYRKMSISHNPYGDGKASEYIVSFILKVLND